MHTGFSDNITKCNATVLCCWITQGLYESADLGLLHETYVKSIDAFNNLLDSDDTCWGSGLYVHDARMSKSSWHKVIIYVTAHLGYANYGI